MRGPDRSNNSLTAPTAPTAPNPAPDAFTTIVEEAPVEAFDDPTPP